MPLASGSAECFSLARVGLWDLCLTCDCFVLGYLLAIDVEWSVGVWKREEKNLCFNPKAASSHS